MKLVVKKKFTAGQTARIKEVFLRIDEISISVALADIFYNSVGFLDLGPYSPS
jgi:hypothetical protein